MSFCVSHRAWADREESSDRGQQGRGQEAQEAEAQQAVKEAAKEVEEEEEEGEEGKWILQLCKEVPPPLRGEVAQASFVAARRKCALSFR
jgi:hypothetical protein